MTKFEEMSIGKKDKIDSNRSHISQYSLRLKAVKGFKLLDGSKYDGLIDNAT